VNEKRLQQVVKDHAMKIEELESLLVESDKEKLAVWMYIDKSDIPLPASLAQLRPESLKKAHEARRKAKLRANGALVEEVDLIDGKHVIKSQTYHVGAGQTIDPHAVTIHGAEDIHGGTGKGNVHSRPHLMMNIGSSGGAGKAKGPKRTDDMSNTTRSQSHGYEGSTIEHGSSSKASFLPSNTYEVDDDDDDDDDDDNDVTDGRTSLSTRSTVPVVTGKLAKAIFNDKEDGLYTGLPSAHLAGRGSGLNEPAPITSKPTLGPSMGPPLGSSSDRSASLYQVQDGGNSNRDSWARSSRGSRYSREGRDDDNDDDDNVGSADRMIDGQVAKPSDYLDYDEDEGGVNGGAGARHVVGSQQADLAAYISTYDSDSMGDLHRQSRGSADRYGKTFDIRSEVVEDVDVDGDGDFHRSDNGTREHTYPSDHARSYTHIAPQGGNQSVGPSNLYGINRDKDELVESVLRASKERREHLLPPHPPSMHVSKHSSMLSPSSHTNTSAHNRTTRSDVEGISNGHAHHVRSPGTYSHGGSHVGMFTSMEGRGKGDRDRDSHLCNIADITGSTHTPTSYNTSINASANVTPDEHDVSVSRSLSEVGGGGGGGGTRTFGVLGGKVAGTITPDISMLDDLVSLQVSQSNQAKAQTSYTHTRSTNGTDSRDTEIRMSSLGKGAYPQTLIPQSTLTKTAKGGLASTGAGNGRSEEILPDGRKVFAPHTNTYIL
jgi:hypothetical protein